MVRKHIIVEGRVQGVGFRYNAALIASKYKVTGYAKNLDNGSVELEAQGTPEAVDVFIMEIKKGTPFARVTALYQDDIDIKEKEKSFKTF
ncbi:acylphosphatase [Alloiococcus sp. CFN-8]|uniref:acylphosphatase n=1 Tax=Alloiococcus sp. CFN-8 TaxID=3416081 RepID=UPI003CF0E9DA